MSEHDLMVNRAWAALHLIEEIAAHQLDERAVTPWNEVFRLAHAGRNPTCQDAHPDWLEPIDREVASWTPIGCEEPVP